MPNREKFLNSKHPFTLKLNPQWECFSWSTSDWCKNFGRTMLNVRAGESKYQQEPIWERTCETTEMTLGEFFAKASSDPRKWMYFDYAHLNTLFPDDHQLIKGIQWSSLGFPEYNGKQSTIWIGSKDAHTPCHQDSYGCNIVVQISGRKRWWLMPPEEINHLKPTRVPYEESTIYSQLNFFTPSLNILEIGTIYEITLERGDVLFVPRHWWHYVENLDTSISVNVWIPLEEDHESRLEEALVRKIVYSMIQDLSEDEKKKLINKNCWDIFDGQLNDELLLMTANVCANNREEGRRKLVEDETNEDGNYGAIEGFHKLSNEDIEKVIRNKEITFNYSAKHVEVLSVNPNGRIELPKLLIDSLCHPHSIRVAKRQMLCQYLKE